MLAGERGWVVLAGDEAEIHPSGKIFQCTFISTSFWKSNVIVLWSLYLALSSV